MINAKDYLLDRLTTKAHSHGATMLRNVVHPEEVLMLMD
jgi:hypothetical protein